MQREHPNWRIAPFSGFFLSLYAVVGGWRSCDFVAPQAAGPTALGIHSADSNALKMAF
jgi:hypothetical protein